MGSLVPASQTMVVPRWFVTPTPVTWPTSSRVERADLHHCSAQRRPVLLDQARHRAVRAQAQLAPGFDRPVGPDHARSYGTATYVDDEDADGPHPLARRSCRSGRTLLMPLAAIKAWLPRTQGLSPLRIVA